MKNIIVAITGASGAIYGQRLLEVLSATKKINSHLIISNSTHITIKEELILKLDDLQKMADYHYAHKDISACISSGSHQSDAMIIAPCSIRTMSAIATGNTDNLISRSADVILKERKKLIILLRETPLHSIHLENMKKLSDCGAIIMPPVPAFYIKPKSLDDIINHTVGRVLDLLDIETSLIKRWQGVTK